MEEFRKKLLITSGILSFIMFAVFLSAAFLVIFIPETVANIYELISKYIKFDFLDKALFRDLVVIVLALVAAVNLTIGIYYIIYSKFSFADFMENRTSFNLLLVAHFILGGALVPLVLAISSLIIARSYSEIDNTKIKNQVNSSEYERIINEINSIKVLNHKNKISKKEYEKRLNECLSQLTKLK